MTKAMSEFTTDLQHSGMPAKDLDETIEFYTKKLGFELAGLFHNGENRCAFLRYGHLTIETWERRNHRILPDCQITIIR